MAFRNRLILRCLAQRGLEGRNTLVQPNSQGRLTMPICDPGAGAAVPA